MHISGLDFQLAVLDALAMLEACKDYHSQALDGPLHIHGPSEFAQVVFFQLELAIYTKAL